MRRLIPEGQQKLAARAPRPCGRGVEERPIESAAVGLVDFDLLPEHLEACGWRGVLESGDVRHCRNYSSRLLAKAAGAAAELSSSDSAALRYIGGVCAAMLTQDKREPFAPAIVLADRRSAMPSDLSDREVELLRWLVENARDHPEIRARAADYLWLRRSDHRMAEVAIEAYFDSAAELERGTPASTPTGETGAGASGPVSTEVTSGGSVASRPRRFHGTVWLDPERVGRDASRIADEVISHLAGQVGSEVTVILEIEAELPDGASDQIVRTVTENSRTLRFTSQGFESE